MQRINRFGRQRALIVAALCAQLLLSPSAAAQQPAPLLEQARQALIDNDARSALIHLRNLLKQDPRNIDGRSLLGRIQFANKDFAGAAKELQVALRLGSEDPAVLLMLARAYLELGEVQRIIDDIEIPRDASKRFAAQVTALRAQATLMKGDEAESEKGFHEALELDPINPEALAGLARLALIRKQPENALELAERALEHAPTDVQIWTLQAETLRKLGRHKDAADSYARLLELAPDNVAGITGIAAYALRNGRVEEAENGIARALEIQETYIPARYLKALIAYRRTELDEASAILEEIVSGPREHLPSHVLLGTIRYRQDHLEQADAHLGRSYAKDPENLPATKLYAATLMKLGQPGRATEVLEYALAHNANDPRLLALLGNAKAQEGEHQDAAELLIKAVELDPEDAAFRAQLALSQLAEGNTNAAINELEMAVDLGMSRADYLLILTHLREENYDQAIAAAEILATKQPDSASPYNLLGAALAGKGDDEGARAAFNKGLAADPDSVSAQFNLARIELRSGETEQAKRRLDTILAAHPNHLNSAAVRASLALEEQDERTGEYLLVRAFETNRKSLKAGLLLSNYYLRNDRTADALAIAREVATNHPQSAAAQRGLAMALTASGDDLGAESALRNALLKVPDDPELRVLLAAAQGRAGKYLDAKNNFLHLLDTLPDDPRVLAGLAAAHLQLREFTHAKHLAEQLQEDNPDLAVGYRLAGDAARYTTPDDAVPHYRKAVALDPSQKHYLLLYAVEARNGVDAAARNTAQRWADAYPDDVRPPLLLADDAGKRDHGDEAIVYYEQALKIDPDHTAALNNIAWLLLEKKDPRAMEFAGRAHQLEPDDTNIADTYALTLVRLGDAEKGVELLRKNVSRAPHNGNYAFHLAEGLYAVGRKKDALRRLRRLLTSDREFSERIKAEQRLKTWRRDKR